jgi:hypothetical protein
MQMEATSHRYIVREKTFIVNDLDMERVAQKKVGRHLQKLNPDQQEAFARVARAIVSVIIWKRFNQHVLDALTSVNPMGRSGNIYQLQQDINKILRRTERWVSRKKTFSDAEVREFAVNIYRSSKSICRIFDRQATCWEQEAESKVSANV